VLNAAARLARVVPANSIMVCHVCCTPTCTGWSLDVPERVQYKLGVTVRRCQQLKVPLPQYIDCVTPASDISSRQRLHSASRHQLLLPRYQLSSLGRLVGPSLSLDQRLGIRYRLTSVIRHSDVSFRRSLKTFLIVR